MRAAGTHEATRTVHLIGVCGAGMSGIARVLLQRGHTVTGSDLNEGRTATELRGLGARIDIGHGAGNVGEVDVVVVSTAVSEGNPEVIAARERGIPVIPRAAMLAELMVDRTAVLVAGTHGKTTTTSMVVIACQAATLDPSFAIGGSLNESGTNAHAGTDALFVAEADESDRSLLLLAPDVAVITNAELDHPDVYRDTDDVLDTFARFLERRRPGGTAIVCLDDPGARSLIDRAAGPVVTYGTDPAADVRLLTAPTPTVRVDGVTVPLTLRVPGRHNELNATAALAVCRVLGLDPEVTARGLGEFTGAARRFQHIGEVGGITVVDDYAHHPTELRATLAAARSLRPSRVVVVVQPHRFSRTATLGVELGRAAAGADLVLVTDVYGAGEPPQPGITGRLVADAAAAAGTDVRYLPHLGDVIDVLEGETREGDVVITTGAGDVTQVASALVARLRAGHGG